MDLRSRKNNGFTLIELLVSMTIFTVVMTITVGTLLVLIDANAKAQNMQVAMTNLNFALDSMTREIRTGSFYFCHTGDINVGLSVPNNDGVAAQPPTAVADCTAGGGHIQIIEGGSSLTEGVTGQRISYGLAPGYYGSGSDGNPIGAIVRRLGHSGSGQDWFPITSPELDIDSMKFIVSGTATLNGGSNNVVQPTVTIFLQGKAGPFEATDVTFSIHTTVNQRQLDL